MHLSINHTLRGFLVASALAFTAVGGVTPGEARGGGGGHGGGGGGAFMGGGGFHGGGGGFMGGGGGFHGGGFDLGGGGGFHGGGGSYQAHDFGGMGLSHSVRGIHRDPRRYGWYGGGYACDPYLVNPQPPYCMDNPY
jgi:hypothetical protein